MNTKITTHIQINALRKGDILKKYPITGNPAENMKDEQTDNCETFDLRTINNDHKVLGLVMSRSSQKMFSSPGDIAREFIRFQEMINQGIWWQWTIQ